MDIGMIMVCFYDINKFFFFLKYFIDIFNMFFLCENCVSYNGLSMLVYCLIVLCVLNEYIYN